MVEKRSKILAKTKAMDNLLKIRLRALNLDLKHDREYRIILGQDLFSNWYVVVMFGKYGTWGRNKTTYFNTREEAYSFIDNRLKRRLSSPKRIGCSYQIVSFDGDGEIIQKLNKSVIERFSWFQVVTQSERNRKQTFHY